MCSQATAKGSTFPAPGNILLHGLPDVDYTTQLNDLPDGRGLREWQQLTTGRTTSASMLTQFGVVTRQRLRREFEVR